jgi:hypothetical protein
MSDLTTQLRDYFDANVERVTADDVFAGRHVVDQVTELQPRWRSSPRLAVGFGFAVTVLIVGGSLGLGLVLRQPGDDAGSGIASFGIGAGTPESTGWGLLGAAAALAVVAIVFMVLALRSARRSSRTGDKENAMSTTLDTPPVDHRLEEAHRRNRWLIAAVVVLAIAVIALGAWVVTDLTATSATEVPAEISTMLDGYTGTWNDYDGDAFLGYIREMSFVHSSYGGEFDAAATASIIDGWENYGYQVEVVGEGMYIGDGTAKYVVQPIRITSDANPEGASGFDVMAVTESGADGWVVIRHTYIGERLG